MTTLQAFTFCLLVAVCQAALPQPVYPPAKGTYKGMPYSFNYIIKDPNYGVDFGQDEKSDGNVVSGVYHVLLPDTRRQIVTYTADHQNGYRADVKYEGKAVFPSYAPPKQAYPAPGK